MTRSTSFISINVFTLVNCPQVKHDNHKELCVYRHSGSRKCQTVDTESALTLLSTSQLPKSITERWNLHTREVKDVPNIKDLLVFLTNYVNLTASANNTLVRSEFTNEPCKRPIISAHATQPSQAKNQQLNCLRSYITAPLSKKTENCRCQARIC